MERRSNSACTLIRVSIRDFRLKRYCLIFPKGKGLLGGWKLLTEKLRGLGLRSREGTGNSKRAMAMDLVEKGVKPLISKGKRSKEPLSFGKIVESGHLAFSNAVRLTVREEDVRHRLGKLACSLVG